MAGNPRRRRFVVTGVVRFLAVFVTALLIALLPGRFGATPAAQASAFAATTAAVAARPLVAIFPMGLGEKAPATREPQEGEHLSLIATRTVREHLAHASVVDAVLYTPGSPVFTRALQENKLTIARRAEPTATERIALGKAIGAIFVLGVQAQATKEGGIEIVVQANEVAGGKVWQDRTQARSTGGSISPRPGQGNDLQTATNTVVARFLAGPLGEYTRTAPSASQLPLPAPKPVASDAPASAADAEALALAARRQGDALLSAGDINGAIASLRRAINLSPRDLYLRATLVRAYLAARRHADAVSEVRRGLTVALPSDRRGRLEMSRLLAQTLAQSGDANAARVTYEQIIAAQPRAHWARIALAELMLSRGEVDDAEKQYLVVRGEAPEDRDAALGMARIRAARGDYEAALRELSGNDADAATRYAISRDLFDEGAARVAALLSQNRKAWEAGKLSREVFYKATTAQSDRITALLALLKAVPLPPSEDGNSAGKRAYRQRVLAVSLLSQAVTGLLTFLETGDNAAGAQASVLLIEFQKELAQARSASEPSNPPGL